MGKEKRGESSKLRGGGRRKARDKGGGKAKEKSKGDRDVRPRRVREKRWESVAQGVSSSQESVQKAVDSPLPMETMVFLRKEGRPATMHFQMGVSRCACIGNTVQGMCHLMFLVSASSALASRM